jgi:excinuclease UvrABC nuclease subunit
MTEISWSDWLDFNQEQFSVIPESPGVFMMHAAMKILYIGGSENLRESITKLRGEPCVCDAKRFRYAALDSHIEVKERLLSEYKQKHDGKMPICME